MTDARPSHAPLDDRIDILKSRVSSLKLDSAMVRLEQLMASGKGGYVCFTNVHTVVMGLLDPSIREITNGSAMSLADGKPIYWAARSRGCVGHVPGPDFMLAALEHFRHRGHFFYGSTPEVLEMLRSALLAAIPDLNICGLLSPPFRAMSPEERSADYEAIRSSGAQFVWVGLGAPKQEQWMAEASECLNPAILLGVGAAFDFHAGNVRRAPRLMRLAGLEWLYRLCQQPRRLWRRYLVTNSLFVTHILLDSVKRIFTGKH